VVKLVKLDKAQNMKIMIVALNYAPEMVGCAKYTTELAEQLAASGHNVQVICGPPYYPKWVIEDGYRGTWWGGETRANVRVLRTPLFVPRKVSGLTRLLHLASFGLATLPTALWTAWRFRPDLVFAVAPSLASAPAALAAGSIARAKKWLHIQDFEVDAAFDLGLLSGRSGRALALSIEKTIFRSFDRVSTISPAMMSLLLKKGVDEARITELRNWVDVDTTRVFESSNTQFRSELNIGESQVVALYSGNMAAKQGIEMLGEVAALVQSSNKGIQFVFCGDGPARKKLEETCKGLNNVSFLPLQPLERLPELLGTADIHLLPQRPEAADLVLPSKLTGMLASGRPVVAMAETGSGLADEVEGCGAAVAPTSEAMAQAVLALSADDTQRRVLGAAARRRAELRWRKDSIISQFEVEAAQIVQGGSGE
jgi:colanic acid biosynthesis glycosyl transferase WcaI